MGPTGAGVEPLRCSRCSIRDCSSCLYWLMVLSESLVGALATFMPGGRAPAKGEIFKNPDLARTYERIAEGGRAAFYEGPIAAAIDATVRELGGYLSAEDLAAHRGEWVEPVSTTYRGHEVYELPPNGQGIAALQMLNILEAYDLTAMGFGSAEYLHVLIEAKKLAFADRARFYADPTMADVPDLFTPLRHFKKSAFHSSYGYLPFVRGSNFGASSSTFGRRGFPPKLIFIRSASSQSRYQRQRHMASRWNVCWQYIAPHDGLALMQVSLKGPWMNSISAFRR